MKKNGQVTFGQSETKQAQSNERPAFLHKCRFDDGISSLISSNLSGRFNSKQSKKG